jgi:DNA-binding response OmpR family regulator
MRIFVVDDEIAVAETLGELVSDLGHCASVAHSAEAALTALDRDASDAILLDIYLPGMNGLEFLRRRRLRRTNTPVIGISGLTTEAQMWECLRLGALDVVRKPVSLELLAALILYVESRRSGSTTGGLGFAEHRRSARTRLTMPVSLVERGGTASETVSLDLSAFGMRLQPRPGGRPTEHARLVFTPPGGHAMLDLCAVLVRDDPRGWTYRFVNLASDQFGHIQRLVAELAVRPGPPRSTRNPAVGRQPGTLRIIRPSGSGATPSGYTLTYDVPGGRVHSRRCATDSELIHMLTALRVSPGTRVTAILELAAFGGIVLQLGATEDDLRLAGFRPIVSRTRPWGAD